MTEAIRKEIIEEEGFEKETVEIRPTLYLDDFESAFDEAGVINNDIARMMLIKLLELQSYICFIIIAYKRSHIWFDPRVDEIAFKKQYNILKDNFKYIGFTEYEHDGSEWTRWYAKTIDNILIHSEKNVMLEEFISKIL